ncbi:hypothetical protein [Vreelandella venusta]|uniref:hypothetical protein n=1 Tax=Vreelandella venusta TaxID=44935 RepID=UPI001166981A|nr:hypothetical protein [Halomonas venusta]GEK52314.1 hypothetical protein HVE01_30350 [Halomonas venusta]
MYIPDPDDAPVFSMSTSTYLQLKHRAWLDYRDPDALSEEEVEALEAYENEVV